MVAPQFGRGAGEVIEGRAAGFGERRRRTSLGVRWKFLSCSGYGKAQSETDGP